MNFRLNRKNSKLVSREPRWFTLAKRLMSFALHAEPIPDTIALTRAERALKEQLEAIVERGIQQFLETGLALSQLRAKRLYRVTHPTFEAYVRDRFGLARSTVDGVIRSAQTAESLREAGVDLSHATEASIRPLSAFTDPDLQSACWQLAETFTPERNPTVRLVGKLCAVVRECLESPPPDDDDDPDDGPSKREGFYRGPRPAGFEVPFCRPVARLASWSGFSVSIIVAGVDKPESAANLHKSCGILIERCKLVQERLADAYPQILSHA